LGDASASTPVARYGVSCAPRLERPEAAEQAPERFVAEEIDGLLGEGELDVLRRFLRQASRAEDLLVTGRHLWLLVDLEVPLRHQTLDDLVDQFRDLLFHGGIELRISGRLAAEIAQHLGCELVRLHQGLHDRLPEGIHRPVVAGILVLRPERVHVAREAALEQEIAQLLDQVLEVDLVGELREELFVPVGSHAVPRSLLDPIIVGWDGCDG
jgi:hypothetical protein